MNLKPTYDPESRKVIDQFIRTKVREAGAEGVVLGLSGGLDSAVTAALASHALGKDKVHCLLMPYDLEQEKESVEHAVLMAEGFELDHHIIPIKESVDSLLALGELTDVEKKLDMTAAGNVKARIRMVTLFYHANLNNYLVLGTSNKSELLVGYFAKYGDGGSDAMPIGDLYKTQVFELGSELCIPGKIRMKPPTAGLVKGQTDEGDLGLTYAELDQILSGIERLLALDDISDITGITVGTVRRIQTLVHRSAHKRHLGMIPKIGLRTPGYDWRENVSLLSFPHESLG